MYAVDDWSYSSSDTHSNRVVNLAVPVARWLPPKTGSKASHGCSPWSSVA